MLVRGHDISPSAINRATLLVSDDERTVIELGLQLLVNKNVS